MDLGPRNAASDLAVVWKRLHGWCYNLAMSRGMRIRNLRSIGAEWGAIVFGFLSLACFNYWAVSLASNRADFELSFGHSRTVQMASADGSIKLCDHFENLVVMELVQKGIPFEPAPRGTYQWTMPGIAFHCLTFGDNSTIWSLNVSWLIPGLLLLIVATLCLVDFRRRRVHATARE
jgi:hypothetical protein